MLLNLYSNIYIHLSKRAKSFWPTTLFPKPLTPIHSQFKIKIRLIEKLHSPAPRQNKSIEHYQEASITLYGIPLKFVSPFRSRCIETSIEPGGHGVRPLAMESKRNKRTKNKKERAAAAAASPGEILGRSSTALCFVLREIATSPVGRANQLDIYDRGWPVAAASAAPWPRLFAATAG